MAINAPERIWWVPLGRQERLWVAASLVFVAALFLTIPLWDVVGRQGNPREVYQVSPDQFRLTTNDFIARYQVGSEGEIPVVRPPEGDVYLMGFQWQWRPILELKKGQTYRLHLSALDLQHGFSLQPLNMNFQVLPGYDHVLTLTPTSKGEFTIVCNEFCGIGHSNMSGKIFVQ